MESLAATFVLKMEPSLCRSRPRPQLGKGMTWMPRIAGAARNWLLHRENRASQREKGKRAKEFVVRFTSACWPDLNSTQEELP